MYLHYLVQRRTPAKPIPSIIYLQHLQHDLGIVWEERSRPRVKLELCAFEEEGAGSDSICSCPSLCAAASIIHSDPTAVVPTILMCGQGECHLLRCNTFVCCG